jgi:hypothetical protein
VELILFQLFHQQVVDQAVIILEVAVAEAKAHLVLLDLVDQETQVDILHPKEILVETHLE